MTATTPTYHARDYGHEPGGPFGPPVQRIIEAADREHGPDVPIVIRFDSDVTIGESVVIKRHGIEMTLGGNSIQGFPSAFPPDSPDHPA